MFKRHRFEQALSLKDRLASLAKGGRAQATQLPPGIEKEELLQKAREADTAAHIEEWANSAGLRPPT